jgi:hypothetical protein
MAQASQARNWLPALWAGLAIAILAGDYFTGPFVSLAILFVVPVALAARFSGLGWGVTWAVLMALIHFSFGFLRPVNRTIEDSLINAAIRTAALVVFAVLIDRTTRQAREIRVLRGLIPVCAFCKKIRTEDQKWLPMEIYITQHSEATFTSTFCPACAAEHYGEYFENLKQRQSDTAESSAPPPCAGTGKSGHDAR